MRLTLICVTALLSFGFSLKINSTIAEDLLKIQEKYASQDYSFKMKFEYFNTYNQSSPNEILHGNMICNGQQFHYRIGSNEVIRTTNYIVSIDHDNRMIMLDTVKLETQESYIQTNIDSLLRLYQGVIRMRTSGELMYKFPDPSPGICNTVLYINSDDFSIKSLDILFYDQRRGREGQIRNRLKIHHSAHQFPTQEEVGTIDTYFKLVAGGVKPTEQFNSYTFLNNL